MASVFVLCQDELAGLPRTASISWSVYSELPRAGQVTEATGGTVSGSACMFWSGRALAKRLRAEQLVDRFRSVRIGWTASARVRVSAGSVKQEVSLADVAEGLSGVGVGPIADDPLTSSALCSRGSAAKPTRRLPRLRLEGRPKSDRSGGAGFRPLQPRGRLPRCSTRSPSPSSSLIAELVRWMVGTVIATATLTVGILRLLG